MPLARRSRYHGGSADYGREQFMDDFEVCIVHLQLPVTHRGHPHDESARSLRSAVASGLFPTPLASELF
jgi:hypothetical protein